MDLSANSYVDPSGPGQLVAYTGTAGTIANALPQGAQAVWVFCTSIAHVKVSYNGDATAATTADFPVPASVPVKIPLQPGKTGVKVSAIQSAAGGNLHVCPINF
jgi:hypothetical protein